MSPTSSPGGEGDGSREEGAKEEEVNGAAGERGGERRENAK
jgi:hypothetical protein